MCTLLCAGPAGSGKSSTAFTILEGLTGNPDFELFGAPVPVELTGPVILIEWEGRLAFLNSMDALPGLDYIKRTGAFKRECQKSSFNQLLEDLHACKQRSNTIMMCRA